MKKIFAMILFLMIYYLNIIEANAIGLLYTDPTYPITSRDAQKLKISMVKKR